MYHTPEEEHVVYKAIKKRQKSSSSMENNLPSFLIGMLED